MSELPLPDYTARRMIELLAAKHSGDVFVSECKTGPTQTAGARPLRMDAWVMPRSWSKPDVVAYEVKVSRSDFLRDDKWPSYLDYCNALYFVTPPKLIQPGELPEGVGLLECTRNAARLLTKRKAPRRDVEIPEDVFRYVLMARARITGANHESQDSSEGWAQWLRERKRKRELGWEVRGKIRELYRENVERVDEENRRLQSKLEGLEKAAEILKAMGITSVDSWRIEDRIREAREGISRDLGRRLKMARESIERLEDELERVST